MPVMSGFERALCSNPLWNGYAGRRLLPWVVRFPLRGDALEIGCGGGAMAEHLLRLHDGVRLTATDLDARMVRRARRRLGDRARVICADATALPFDDASFDVVLNFLMLHHVVAWEDALRECARVLRPGGRLVGFDLLDTRAMRWAHRVDRSPVRLIGTGDLSPALASAGLTVDRVTVTGGRARFLASKP